jgi:lipid-A-disaccharide synthase
MIPMTPDRQAARASLGLPEGGPVVALLPGSRQSEVKHLAGRFFQAARLLLRERPELHFALPVLPALRAAVEQAARAAGWSGPDTQALHLVDGRSHQVLAACDAALVASGTATLEAALFKRPRVIASHMPWLSWQIMRRKQLQPWVGLPNILSREFVVPELLQERATPEALAEGVLHWLKHPQEAQALAQRFERLHHDLRRDTARLACDAIEKIIAA